MPPPAARWADVARDHTGRTQQRLATDALSCDMALDRVTMKARTNYWHPLASRGSLSDFPTTGRQFDIPYSRYIQLDRKDG
jgi:hypothetical protein